MKIILAILAMLSRPKAQPKPVEPVVDDSMLSQHFSKAEFACNHCGKLHPSGTMPPLELLDILEGVREHFGVPVVVNSGYRCPTHNANVGGATASRHMVGDASDIMVSGVNPHDVHAYLDKVVGSKGGVGKYTNFTHVDTRGSKARW